MNWRNLHADELDECLDIAPRHLGDEIAGREAALAVWKGLIANRSFNSAVVEDSANQSAQTIVAFGSSVFVDSQFATAELAHPTPNLNSRIIGGLASGAPVLRPAGDLYDTSPNDPLDLVVLNGSWRREAYTTGQLNEIQMLLAYSFVEMHIGYRLNRLFIETIGKVQRDFHESSGVWRIVKNFANTDRALAVMTERDAFAASGSVAASLFQYQRPVLSLRDNDKQLLIEALHGGNDNELATRMNLSPASVKKRWQSLFERISDMRPGFLADSDKGALTGVRGSQKRHHIVAYVRSHPQELRPFRWRSPIRS